MDIEIKHCHGIDCCWDCFHGKSIHPRDNEDHDCKRELKDYPDAAIIQGCNENK